MNAANDPTGREWRAEVNVGPALHGFTLRAVASLDVWSAAVDRFPDATAVRVSPVIELTEAEGRARFPKELHPQASSDAWLGWERAKRGAEVPTQIYLVAA